MTQRALGLIETLGLVAAIEAADTALKTAAVELIACRKVKGGLVTVGLAGEVAAVQAAVEAGSAAAARLGRLISRHVIPRPLADTGLLLGGETVCSGSHGPGPETPGGQSVAPIEALEEATTAAVKDSSAESYEQYLNSLSVVDLRRLARQAEGLTIKGREISRANRDQLVKELLKAGELKD